MSSEFKSKIAKFYFSEPKNNKVSIIFKISKKIGSAPQRNRIKRLFREAFRLEFKNISKAFDIIVVPFRLPYELSFDIVRKEVRNLFDKKYCSIYNNNL